jgi:aminoglycoside phosphotransferase (APT) family kinase protein
MPTMWKRDLEADRRRLAEWIGGVLPDARDVVVSELVAPQSSGFSNDTLLFELCYSQDGEARADKLVVRIAPIGFKIFPEYDLGLQYRTMKLLAPTDIPVPRVYWLEEEDDTVLGAPFYVMGQVAGRVPPDNPPYHMEGWLKEAAPEERRGIWRAGFEAMAKIHRLDYAALGFSFLEKPHLGAAPIDWELAYYRDYLNWAGRGLEHPIVEAALEWISKNKPNDEPTVLVWGDARIGNIIFDGVRPAAVLDWEMVTLGSPEMDVGWSIFLDRHHSEGIDTPRLEGFDSYDETLARYEQLSGFEIRNPHFYEIFCGFRFSIIMMRIAQQLVHYELIDEAAGREFELNNTVTRLLAKMLEIPPPGESSGSFTR